MVRRGISSVSSYGTLSISFILLPLLLEGSHVARDRRRLVTSTPRSFAKLHRLSFTILTMEFESGCIALSRRRRRYVLSLFLLPLSISLIFTFLLLDRWRIARAGRRF